MSASSTLLAFLACLTVGLAAEARPAAPQALLARQGCGTERAALDGAGRPAATLVGMLEDRGQSVSDVVRAGLYQQLHRDGVAVTAAELDALLDGTRLSNSVRTRANGDISYLFSLQLCTPSGIPAARQHALGDSVRSAFAKLMSDGDFLRSVLIASQGQVRS